MLELNWRDYLVIVSFAACIVGLVLMSEAKAEPGDDLGLGEEILLKMSFTYWIVYCLSVFGMKIPLPEWLSLLLNLKMTAIFSYLLTGACILCLPLQRMAVQQVED